MARVNVYLPDELATAARAAGINVSNVTQDALRRELAARRTEAWLDRIAALPPAGVTHREAVGAVQAARDEFGESA
jgi:post-segregation antitoxin (ccd killing protein)